MKSCLLKSLHNEQSYISPQGRSKYCFQIEREVLKNDGVKAGQHWELKVVLLVPGEEILISIAAVADVALQNILNSDTILPLRIFLPLGAFLGTPTVSSLK